LLDSRPLRSSAAAPHRVTHEPIVDVDVRPHPDCTSYV